MRTETSIGVHPLRVLAYPVLVWFLFLVLAVVNGAFRVSSLMPRFGEQVGHVTSTILLSCIIVTVTYFFVRKTGRYYTERGLVYIGVFWMVSTVAFEFLFGHYVVRAPWEKLLSDYNVLEGKVWVLVLIVELISPYLFGKRLGRRD